MPLNMTRTHHPLQIERRYAPSQVEVRQAGGASKIFGYAVPWDSLSVPLPFVGGQGHERFMKGAFSRALARPDLDVVALRDHDSRRLLGRTPKTLRIHEDNHGLAYEIDPPDTEEGRSIIELIRRGDIRGSSFTFTLDEREPGWGEYETRDGERIRTIRNISQLVDVSPVIFPAYPATEVTARSFGAFYNPSESDTRELELELRLADLLL